MNYVQQVGGDHYKADIQHWDLIEKFDVSYLEATATKYVVRIRKKGKPVEDIDKAISYLKKMLATRNDGVRRHVPVWALEQFLGFNPLPAEEAQVLHDVLVDGCRGAVIDAIRTLEHLKEQLAS